MQESSTETDTPVISITDIISQAAKDSPKSWLNAQYIEEKRRVIHDACLKKGLEHVWDEFMSYVEPGTVAPAVDVSGSSSEDAQIAHSVEIAKQEAGDTKSVQKSSFGITYPSYQYAFAPYQKDFAAKAAPKGLLIGSMSEHSANEFEALLRTYNPTSHAVAIDRGCVGLLRASDAISKAQADTSDIPLVEQSMDIVASKYLHSPAKSRGKTIIDTLKETHRLLKKDGVLLMVEETLPLTQTYETAWMSRLLLEETLASIGFADIKSDYATSFATHKDKIDWNTSKLHRSDSMHQIGFYGPYNYVTSAKK